MHSLQRRADGRRRKMRRTLRGPPMAERSTPTAPRPGSRTATPPQGPDAILDDSGHPSLCRLQCGPLRGFAPKVHSPRRFAYPSTRRGGIFVSGDTPDPSRPDVSGQHLPVVFVQSPSQGLCDQILLATHASALRTMLASAWSMPRAISGCRTSASTNRSRSRK